MAKKKCSKCFFFFAIIFRNENKQIAIFFRYKYDSCGGRTPKSQKSLISTFNTRILRVIFHKRRYKMKIMR